MQRKKLNTILRAGRLTGEEIGLLFIDDAIEAMQTGKGLFAELEKEKIINCLDKTHENIRDYNNIVPTGGLIDQLRNTFLLMGLEFAEAGRVYLTISLGLIEERFRYKAVKFGKELNAEKKLTNIDLQNLMKIMNPKEVIPASTYSELIKGRKYTNEIFRIAMKHYAFANILYTALSLFADKFNKKKIRELADNVKIRTDFDANLIGWITDDTYRDVFNDKTVNNKERAYITERLDEMSGYTLGKIIDKSLMPTETSINKASEYVESKPLGQINLLHITQILEEA